MSISCNTASIRSLSGFLSGMLLIGSLKILDNIGTWNILARPSSFLSYIILRFSPCLSPICRFHFRNFVLSSLSLLSLRLFHHIFCSFLFPTLFLSASHFLLHYLTVLLSYGQWRILYNAQFSNVSRISFRRNVVFVRC